MTKKYRNFLIVATPRTGSSALAESLDKRNNITCGWEWTNHVAPWKQIKLATRGLDGDFSSLKEHHQQHMERSITDQCQWLGFRRLFRASDKWVIHPTFAPALWVDRLAGHIKWLVKRPDIHIIHIVRYDNIDWLKSKFVAKAAGSYVGRKYPEELKVVIPIDRAVKRLQSKQWVDHRLADLQYTHQYLRLRYEDMLTQREEVTSTALMFLDAGTSIQQGKNVISRQSTGSARDYIANFEELEAALRKKNLLTSSFKA